MFSRTFEELLRELDDYSDEYQIFWSHKRSLPDCFNIPTEEALADPEVFAILYCEDDMIIPKGILKKMFAKNYPVIALDYPFRTDGDSTTLHDPEGWAYWTGTGFMLVARSVLEALEKPIWRTDTTWDPFVDKDTIYFWPRKLKKVFYGLHDLNFGMLLYANKLPIKSMPVTAGQRKLVALGEPDTNNGAHAIQNLTVVGRDIVSGIVEKTNSDLFLGAMNRVKNVHIMLEKPSFISYDDDDQPYLNDGREFSVVK